MRGHRAPRGSRATALAEVQEPAFPVAPQPSPTRNGPASGFPYRTKENAGAPCRPAEPGSGATVRGSERYTRGFPAARTFWGNAGRRRRGVIFPASIILVRKTVQLLK